MHACASACGCACVRLQGSAGACARAAEGTRGGAGGGVWLWVCLGACGCMVVCTRARACVRAPVCVCFQHACASTCAHTRVFGVCMHGGCVHVCVHVFARVGVPAHACPCVCVHACVCWHPRVPVGQQVPAGRGPPPCPCVPTRNRAGRGVQDPPPHPRDRSPGHLQTSPTRGTPTAAPSSPRQGLPRGHPREMGAVPGHPPPGATEPWGRVAVAVRALLLPPSAGGARSHPPVATGGLHGGSPSRVAPGHRRVTAWRRGSGDPSAWIADFGEVPLGQDPPGPHP